MAADNAAKRQEPRPAVLRYNADAPKLTEPIPPEARLCRYHGWYFPWFNAGGLLVCRECMLDDYACSIYTPEGL